ncbi:hypothetical protein LIER_18873 [Lithospermum erythrorhizon]|uniref:Uncharacterized protein n=1 Tax=Lithospermum erythrorhizon TaxID=34254 RepID=A0AAV3QK03_LITER
MERVQPFEAHEDGWEIVNDDGFVYKRKKRRLDPTTTSTAPPPPDPAIEETNRRIRKKKTLMKLKEKYQKELSQWELLSNTLKAMEIKTRNFQETRQDHAPPPDCEAPTSDFEPKKISGKILDELLIQVEAQEAIIQDVSNLCDLAEALCNAEEEKLKQPFIELPIWDYSPQELMTSLCED